MRERIREHVQKHKNFIIYTYVGIVITVLNIFLLWVLIDMMKIPTIISSTAVVGGLFVVKFFLYKKTGFTQ